MPLLFPNNTSSIFIFFYFVKPCVLLWFSQGAWIYGLFHRRMGTLVGASPPKVNATPFFIDPWGVDGTHEHSVR